MFLRHIFMAGLATACGIAVSAGTFAFLLVIGVIPRMIKRCNFGERILMIENTVILGVLTGAVFSVMEWKAQHGAESVKETRFLSASVPDIRQQRISREPGHLP